MLTPRRRRGVEILDDPTTDPRVREQSIGDVTRSNRWLGGSRAASIEVRRAAGGAPRGAALTILDVGTGLGDIPARVRAEAALDGVTVITIGVDEAWTLLAAARDRLDHQVCARATALPFRDQSVDVVMCSQLLHHFETADTGDLVRELDRVARHEVIISDLRRSWIAAAGFWIASFVLRFHPVTRHDGVVSVFRGFTAGELTQIVKGATGETPVVRRRLGYRLTVRWRSRSAA